ncbi:MAG: hypothetical protein HGB23_08870 [Chlorobiaceae bacterium]|nr:hypothetical protein [Chlorobiaceae bacterium]
MNAYEIDKNQPTADINKDLEMTDSTELKKASKVVDSVLGASVGGAVGAAAGFATSTVIGSGIATIGSAALVASISNPFILAGVGVAAGILAVKRLFKD